MYKMFFKRFFDLFISSFIIILASPILVCIFIILFKQNKTKVFFFQERPGLNQKPFNIIKFKTMTDERNQNGNLLPDNQRLTKFGSIIRKLSLDEMPQLINVIIGDMSLIGPRPLLFKYISLYSTEQLRRHELKPGITGWAQINGRNSISWTEKFKLDLYYIDNVIFFFDIKILWLTLLKVIIREGVNQTEDRPMLPFNGIN